MKTKPSTLKQYNNLGSALCAGAGTLLGFYFGGPLLILPGFLVGLVTDRYLKKAVALLV